MKELFKFWFESFLPAFRNIRFVRKGIRRFRNDCLKKIVDDDVVFKAWNKSLRATIINNHYEDLIVRKYVCFYMNSGEEKSNSSVRSEILKSNGGEIHPIPHTVGCDNNRKLLRYVVVFEGKDNSVYEKEYRVS